MTVIALAGRRVDAPESTEARFPEKNAGEVSQRLEEAFRAERAAALVCSGACGADLLALEAAGRLGMKRRMVLPFRVEEFRRTSVTDRGGDWGAMFDRVKGELEGSGDVVLLPYKDGQEEGYGAANEAIWAEAEELARREDDGRLVGMRVWEGRSRGAHDWTEQFGALGKERGARIVEVGTE